MRFRRHTHWLSRKLLFGLLALLAQNARWAAGAAHSRWLLEPSADTEALIHDSSGFWSALADERVHTIFLNTSLILDSAPKDGTVVLRRNVTVQATPELLREETKVYVDFKGQSLVIAINPGMTLFFVGLEISGALAAVGPLMSIFRQSVGGRSTWIDCVIIRRAGLPVDAAVVNIRAFPRPADAAGPQQVVKVYNLTYSTTRSPTQPVRWSEATLEIDFQAAVPADSSLAFQGLYLGGYTWAVFNSYYLPEHVVDPECLTTHPGDECVAALLRQLDAQEAAAAQAAAAPSDSGGLSTTDTIVVAVVVPVGVVLLTAAAAAVVLVRRRRARAAAYAKGALPQTESDSSAPAAGPGGAPSSATRSSDIFMGLEEGSAPPVWTQKHDEEAAAGFSVKDEEQDLLFDNRTSAEALDVGAAAAANEVVSCREQRLHGCALSGSFAPGMRPAFAAAKWAGTAGAAGTGPLAADASVKASRPAVGSAGEGPASVHRGKSDSHVVVGGASGASDVGNSGKGAQQQQQQEAEAAAADSDPGVTVQPAEAPRPIDVVAELSRMARELRLQVKDVAIRIDTVLGTGAFGVVYGGIGQGVPVAVKTVVISASQERRKRALQEAALCQSIVHPNIIATYACELQPIGAPVTSVSSSDAATTDSGRTGLASIMPQIVDWRLYIIQELADGGPLSKLYGRPDIWPAPSTPHMVPVVALALGIARALTHLHSKRIIHGDLSPNNVLLKKDANEPSGYAAKVGDFGLSVMLPQHQSHLSNLRMGTMFYMCPAVILKGQVGPASDVFSLGVILWELYHGRRAGIMTQEGPRYASIFPAFPPSCPQLYVSVALNCLQRQPVNRPKAEAVAQHLEALLQSLMMAAR